LAKFKDREKFYKTGEDLKLSKKFDKLRNKIENSPARTFQSTSTIDLSSQPTYDVRRHKENIKTQYCPHPIVFVDNLILPAIQTPRGHSDEVMTPMEKDIVTPVRGGSVPQGFVMGSSSSDDDESYESFSSEDWFFENKDQD